MFAHMTWTFAYSLLPSGEGAPEGADEGTGEALWSLSARGLRPVPSPHPLSRRRGALATALPQESQASRAARNTPAPRPGPARARAGCNAGVRSR
ncbi:hypothetical protein EYC56_00715 [Xanthomonas oryzae]|nr:hypothetical protein EYC56_00715 [Xanthomonas oryzae]